LWEHEEAARRGFACPREWKQRLTSREYATAIAVANKWYVGDDRRDLGLVKAALLIASRFGAIEKEHIRALYPNIPPEQEQTSEDILEALRQCQPPSPP